MPEPHAPSPQDLTPALETSAAGGAAMRLERIEIEHFRAIAQAKIDFPDGLIGLVGANGSGKSSVLAAIVYALYGSEALPYKKASLIGPGGDLRVAFHFTLGGLSYVVERTLRRRDLAAAAVLTVDGGERARGAEAVSNEIRRLLGGHTELLVSRFVGQKQLNALSSLEAAPRKRLILRLLGVEAAESAVVALRERVTDFDRAVKSRRLALPDLEVVRLEHQRAQEELTVAEAALATARKDHERIEREAEAAERERLAAESVATAAIGIATAIEVTGATLTDLQREHDRLDEKVAELGDPTAELTDLSGRIAAIETSGDELATLHSAAQLRRSLPDLTMRVSTIRGEIGRLESLESTHLTLTSTGTTAEQRLGDLQSELLLAKAERESAEAALSELRARLTLTRETAEEASRRLAALSESDRGVCRSCGRAYEDLASARTHLTDEIGRAKEQIRSTEESGRTTRSRAEAAAMRLDELDREIGELRQQRDQGVGAGAELRLTRAELLARREEITRTQAEIALAEAVAYDLERHQLLEAMTTELPLLLARRSGLTLKAAALAHSREDQRRIEQRQQEALARRVELEAEAKAVGLDPVALEAIRTRQAQANEALAGSRERVARAEGQQQLVAERTVRLGGDLARHQALLAEIGLLLADRSRADLARELMDRFKVELIGKIRPALARKASSLLRDLSDGRYGRLDLDEEYEVSIGNAGALRPIRECSGGEEDLANLCLRLAISQLINESRGIGATFIVLDEVLGSQDPDRQERIMALLPRLAGHFGQILMVAHIPSIQDRFPSVIETNFDPASETSVIYYPEPSNSAPLEAS